MLSIFRDDRSRAHEFIVPHKPVHPVRVGLRNNVPSCLRNPSQLGSLQWFCHLRRGVWCRMVQPLFCPPRCDRPSAPLSSTGGITQVATVKVSFIRRSKAPSSGPESAAETEQRQRLPLENLRGWGCPVVYRCAVPCKRKVTEIHLS